MELTKKVENVQVWKRKIDSKQIYLCEAASGPILEQCGYKLLFKEQAKLSGPHRALHLVKDFLLRSSNRLICNRRFKVS